MYTINARIHICTARLVARLSRNYCATLALAFCHTSVAGYIVSPVAYPLCLDHCRCPDCVAWTCRFHTTALECAEPPSPHVQLSLDTWPPVRVDNAPAAATWHTTIRFTTGGAGDRLHAQLCDQQARCHKEGTSWLATWWNQLGYLQVEETPYLLQGLSFSVCSGCMAHLVP